MLPDCRNTLSAGGVVIGPQGKVLVVSQFGSSWSLPKGCLDPGEDHLAAAYREIHEESGVSQLILWGELGCYERYRIGPDGGDDTSEWKTITMFLFCTEQETLQPLDPDNPEACWLPVEEVAARLTHQQDQAFFLRVLPQIQSLLERLDK